MRIEDIEFIQDYGIFQKGVKLDFSNRVDNFIALVGLSGSGKTTLVNLMAKVFGHELKYSWKWCSDIKKIYNEVCKSYNNNFFLLEDKAKKFIDKEETKMFVYLSKVEAYSNPLKINYVVSDNNYTERAIRKKFLDSIIMYSPIAIFGHHSLNKFYWSRAITDNMKTTPYSDKINEERGINSIYFLQSNFINIAIASLSLLKESEIDLFLSKNNIKFDFKDNFNFKLYENIRIDNVSSGNAVFNNEIAKKIYEYYRIEHDNDIRINDLLCLIEIEDNPSKYEEFRSQFGNSKFDFSIVKMRTPKDKAKILFKFLWSVYYRALNKHMAKQYEYGSIANSSHDWLSIDFFTYMNPSVIENLSEGQKKFLILTLIFKVLADENSLILLDEVDVHLDSKLKSMIFKMIKECKGQVILTTHDPVMVSNMPPENVFMLENGKISENQSLARALAETDNCNMLDALGMQGKPYIVISEGPSDEKIIKKAIEQLGYDDYFRDVFFLNSGGTGNTEHFFENTLIKFRKNLIKKVLFIYDRDEAGYFGRDVIKKLKKKNAQFDSLFITPNDLFYYLYTENGKNEKDYENVPHSINKKDSFDYFYYLENYVDACNYLYNGEVVQITMNGRILTFNEMKKICPSSKDLKKFDDTNNPIIPNCKVKYGIIEDNLTAITLKNVIDGIKNDVLNKTHKKEYFNNFIYLLNDILDALGLPKP